MTGKAPEDRVAAIREQLLEAVPCIDLGEEFGWARYERENPPKDEHVEITHEGRPVGRQRKPFTHYQIGTRLNHGQLKAPAPVITTGFSPYYRDTAWVSFFGGTNRAADAALAQFVADAPGNLRFLLREVERLQPARRVRFEHDPLQTLLDVAQDLFSDLRVTVRYVEPDRMPDPLATPYNEDDGLREALAALTPEERAEVQVGAAGATLFPTAGGDPVIWLSRDTPMEHLPGVLAEELAHAVAGAEAMHGPMFDLVHEAILAEYERRHGSRPAPEDA